MGHKDRVENTSRSHLRSRPERPYPSSRWIASGVTERLRSERIRRTDLGGAQAAGGGNLLPSRNLPTRSIVIRPPRSSEHALRVSPPKKSHPQIKRIRARTTSAGLFLVSALVSPVKPFRSLYSSTSMGLMIPRNSVARGTCLPRKEDTCFSLTSNA